jgi:histidinol dehydrogenase
LLNANAAPTTLLAGSADISALALTRDPPPQPEDLRQRLAARYQVEPQQVLVTRGSDEGIDQLLRVFCRPRQDAIQAAGSVFLGPLTPETLGDYCSGTNHVLPTYGYARAYSGLSVSDFMRRMTVQCADREGLETAGPDAMTLAAAEGLEAHRKAVAWRLGEGG